MAFVSWVLDAEKHGAKRNDHVPTDKTISEMQAWHFGELSFKKSMYQYGKKWWELVSC